MSKNHKVAWQIEIGNGTNSIALDEMSAPEMKIGELYIVVIEEKNDEGELVAGHDTCWIVESGMKKAGGTEMIKAVAFTKMNKRLRFSEMAFNARFYGPIDIEGEQVL